MEFVIAFVLLAIGFVLADRGFLHPYDYVVAGALGLLLAICVIPAIPREFQFRVLEGLRAPESAFNRDEFFRVHGWKIILACTAYAIGACAEGRLRARRLPDKFA